MFHNRNDNDVTTLSSQEKLHQVEYEMESDEQGSATIGLKNSTHASLHGYKASTSELNAHQEKMIPLSTNAQALALKNQLVLFDLLINLRIQMQKSCIKIKTMHGGNFLDDNVSKDARNRATKEIQALLDAFLNLQKLLSDHGIPIENDNYEEKLDADHKNMLNCINDIIVEWWEKTNYVSQVDSKVMKDSQNILENINRILSDRDRLIQKTKIDRSGCSMLNETKTDEDQQVTDNEIYDDDDFYGQLLRQLIESKTSIESVDPITLSRQWLEVQKLRKKMKRKIDTRASKGRRIRYKVHQPLISFMAPIEDGNYEDSAKDILFASLFAQGKVK